MSRPIIWNFHNARHSLVQSCLRELIGRSPIADGGPPSLRSRVESVVRDLIGKVSEDSSGFGLCSGHPVMQAIGNVLDQIDRGTLSDASLARAAYQSERAKRPELQTKMATLSADCLDLLAQYLLTWVLHDETRMNEVKSEYIDSHCDMGWLTAVAAWVGYYWDGDKPQYVPPAPSTVPFPLPPPGSPDGLLRVGVLADWGTGEPEAIAVLDQLMLQKPDLIVHVGDIYYSGTHDECQTNFLEPIKAARKQHERFIPVYTIPGNHDYYSGGTAFYAMLPRLNLGIPHASVQEHSFFCLLNDHWQLECMDTGYNDHDLLRLPDDISRLQDVEAAWHQLQLTQAGSRRVILVSHHQLFSAFAAIGRSGKSYQNPYLTKNLQDWRAAGAVAPGRLAVGT